MKNLLVIDFDSEREEGHIMIKKDHNNPNLTQEELEDYIAQDLFTLMEALCFMGYTAISNGLTTKEEFMEDSIEHLKSVFNDEEGGYSTQTILVKGDDDE